MGTRKHDVVVRKLPAALSEKQGRIFLCEIQRSVDFDRPRMVLDCSDVEYLDKSAIFLMLCCLEEAIKRHGDVRLAALCARARTSLEMMGVNRLFEIYDTTSEAVKGFHQFPVGSTLQAPLPAYSAQGSEDAA